MSKKIKVLILHNYMTPYRFPLFREIAKNSNIDLTVYFMSKSAVNRKWKILPKIGFKYEVLPKIEFNFFGRDLFTYIINYTFPFKFLRSKFDVVISCGWLDFASQAAFVLCKLTGRKFIIWSESTENEPSWRRTLTLPFVKFLVRNSDACVAIGTMSKKYLVSLGAGPEKIFIAYSTVDIDYFRKHSRISNTERERLRRNVGIKTRNVVLYVGQFIDRKGVLYLVKAFEYLKHEFGDTSLILLGYGPTEKQLRDYVKRRGIRDVFFIEHKEVGEMPKMYALADVFVLPSLEETWGLVVNEAMAAGLPVIATRKVGSSSDLIRDSVNGYVVREKDAREICKALTKIVRDKNLRMRMSRNSRRIINHYTPEHAGGEFINAINYSLRLSYR